jgi:hypothetical protein
MDEQQVRLLVRQAIARHMDAPAPSSQPAPVRPSAGTPPTPAGPHAALVSFAQFHLVRPAGETECLIEPTVACNHCGHCQCYGH